MQIFPKKFDGLVLSDAGGRGLIASRKKKNDSHMPMVHTTIFNNCDISDISQWTLWSSAPFGQLIINCHLAHL
jgi:hypothetical protein